MGRKGIRDQVLKAAWIGDAVLALYARERILREGGVVDGPKADGMTSNRFLAAYGEPSETEAEVGRVYSREGLSGAFRWIEANLMPIYERQEAKKRRREGLA